MGLGADIGTYKEPELVEETEIYPLYYLLKGADEKLYVSVDNTAEPQITYYVVKDTRVILNDAAESFILDSKNEVRIVIGDEAKLQEYIVKPEFNLFSFRIGRERTEYVLVVPGDGINNIYSMGGD